MSAGIRVLRGTVETLALVGVIAGVNSFEGLNFEEQWERFAKKVSPIHEQTLSVSVEYKATLRIIDKKFQLLASKVIRPNNAKQVQIQDIHEFLDSILNDRLTDNEETSDNNAFEMIDTSEIDISLFKE